MRSKISILVGLFAAVLGVNAQGNGTNCISITSTSVCAPWSSNLYIDRTELSKVYGLDIETATQWNEIVERLSGGGPTQGTLWSDYLHCPTYKGDPIQYYRTYICLTDIFDLSKSCNPSASISPTLHPEICEVYGKAVKGIVDECPSLTELVNQNDLDQATVEEIFERRRSVLSVIDSCKEFVQNNSKANETQVWGVDSDQKSCGFAGNVDIAEQYCTDVDGTFGQSPSCCQSLGNNGTEHKQSGFKSLKENAIGAQKLEETTGSQSQAGTEGPNVPLIAGTVSGGVVLVAAIAGVVFARRKTPANSKKVQPDPMSEKALKPHETGKRYRVISEYIPTMDDEVELMVGDLVEVEVKYADDWCKGKNIMTGKTGMFPSGVIEGI